MGSLLLERDLRASEEDSEVRSVARARTLTVLGRLDPSRKTALMEFLVEAELVQRVERGRGPIITLTGANLSNLKGDLVFPVGNQVGTTQSTANLKNAILDNANLSDADLPGVDLSHAVLRFADLTGANLELADLTGAYLWGSNLSSAYLGIANLSDANLSDADLSGADLSGADLTGADGVSKEMLKQQAKSLRVATMPDGTVFSDRYATSEFEPALSFSLSEEWQSAAAQERPDRISISGPELVHFQNRCRVRRYSGNHETSHLRPFTFGHRKRALGKRPTLQGRFRHAPSPDHPRQQQGRTRLDNSPLAGMRLPDGARRYPRLQ